MSALTNDLLKAIESVRQNSVWSQSLAQYARVRLNGFENLFQAALLCTFNTLTPLHYLGDLERGGFYGLQGKARIDFLAYDAQDDSNWWRYYQDGRPAEMLRLCRGLVELKLGNGPNAPYYLGLDIERLRQIRHAPKNAQLGVDQKEYLALVLIGGILPAPSIQDLERCFWQGFSNIACKLNESHLLCKAPVLSGVPVGPSATGQKGFINDSSTLCCST